MKSPQELADFLVKRAIEAEFVTLPGGARTVSQAAAALNVPPEGIVKSLLFMVGEKPVLVIASGPTRVDTARLAAYFEVPENQVRLAGSDEVRRITGFDVGSVPPLGHEPGLCTLMDPAVLQFDVVYAGGGAHDQLLRLSPRVILEETEADVVEL
jgi:prolyl-tRNA editing enzyme YbaK/EbsC (Cys-tRNA(Pro) deacylase)